MLRLIGIVISIGLADSLNPTTIAPALYMATGERGRERVAEFTLAVFARLLPGWRGGRGRAPARLIRPLIPHPHHHIANAIEVAVGVAMIGVAGMLWRHRHRLSDRGAAALRSAREVRVGCWAPRSPRSSCLPRSRTSRRSPRSSGPDVDAGARPGAAALLFNVCFVLPLIGIWATLTFAPDRSERLLSIGRAFLERHWPTVLAGARSGGRPVRDPARSDRLRRRRTAASSAGCTARCTADPARARPPPTYDPRRDGDDRAAGHRGTGRGPPAAARRAATPRCATRSARS